MDNVINNVLGAFERHLAPRTPIDQYDQIGRAVLSEKLNSSITGNKKLEFYMLGFPFKSTNERDKVIGKQPDRAELITLSHFDKFDRDIQAVYPNGAVINIISDGYIFNDILEVPDNTVDMYRQVSECMNERVGRPVKFYDLQDFYPKLSLNDARTKTLEQFGVSPEKLEQDILFNPDVNYLYRGMLMFMEEELAYKSWPSRNQLQKQAKRLARQMMFRNEAYSALVRNEFKDSVRLSMHKSINNGQKYSIELIPGSQYSAWHSAIVEYKDGTKKTIHKKDAVAKGYELVEENHQPFYYQEA